MANSQKDGSHIIDHLDDMSDLIFLRPLGLITDIDGTLSEIAPTPDEARVSPSLREKLALLVPQLAVVAALSGRPAIQARDMVGVPGMLYVGNHGLEYLSSGGVELVEEARPYLPAIQSATAVLQASLHIDGVRFEEKGATTAIHYRGAPDPGAARATILDTIRSLPAAAQLGVAEGKMVVELKPPVDVDKGTALRAIVARFRLTALFFLGDDRTDVDVFRAVRWMREHDGLSGLTIAVVGEETPPEIAGEADFQVHSVAEVERFLSWLLERLPR